MRFRPVYIAALAAVLCLSLSSCHRRAGKAADETAVEIEAEEDLDVKYGAELLTKGTQAPGFTLKDPDGRDVSLSDFAGKYVVLDFWATWCPDCREDIPKLKELWETYGSDKVAFLSVAFDTDKDRWAGYIADNGLGWTHVSPLAKWKETQVSKDYHVNWIPTMYLVGPDGKVILATVVLSKLENALAKIKG